MEKAQRYWELDYLRGIAVISMIIYHFFLDLVKIFRKLPPVNRWVWDIGTLYIAGTFLFVAGLAVVLRYNKVKDPWLSSEKQFYKVLFVSILLSIGSLFAPGEKIIVFGILQCIAFSILLGVPFLKWGDRAIYITLIPVFGYGFYFELSGQLGELFNYVSGLMGRGMLDFFPLIPWFGFYLVGILVGRNYKIYGNLKEPMGSGFVKWFGRHALWIYVVHQPILFGLFSWYYS
jgi:uncharacterized membrane protein